METIADRLEKQRAKSAEFFAARREHCDGIEKRLVGDLEAVLAQLNRWTEYREAAAARESELQQRSRQMDERQDELAQLHEKQQKREQELQMTDDEDLASLNQRIAKADQQQRQLASEIEGVRTELSEARVEEDRLRTQLSKARQILTERASQLTTLREELAQAAANANEASSEEHQQVLAKLLEERDQLQDELAVLKLQVDEPTGGATEEELEQLRVRFENAVEEVRYLKTKNEELQNEISELSSRSSSGGRESHDVLSGWELQKQQLMAELGGDTTQTAPAKAPRPVAPPNNSHAEPETAENAPSSLESVLDQDEEIRLERERLQQLQDEWREKMRTAEVELAIERAQNSRQRIEIQEKLFDADDQLKRAKQAADQASSSLPARSQPKRKWLERLGLADDD